MKTKLPNTLKAWHSPAFADVFKSEVRQLPSGSVPLQAWGMRNGLVDDSDLSLTVLNVMETEAQLKIKAGVFFSETIGGCSCGDDPATENAYCEVWVHVCKQTAAASFFSAE